MRKKFKLYKYLLYSKIKLGAAKRKKYAIRYVRYFLDKVQPDINLNGAAQPDAQSIDVLIPVVERDLEILHYALQALRMFSLNPIQRVIIVSPESAKVTEFAAVNQCTHIADDAVPGIAKAQINYNVAGENRSGWLFQQLVKLSWDVLSENQYCLVFDSDTVLTRPQLFVSNGKAIFNCSDYVHQPYIRVLNKLLGKNTGFPLSFVAHHMMFDRQTTQLLKQTIQKQYGENWLEAVLSQVEYEEMSGFSEYELYGHYMYMAHRNKMLITLLAQPKPAQKPFA